jgi:hypothetical protein
VPAKLQRAYQQTLDASNAGIWSATATLCRRTLEGIMANLVPKAKRDESLAQQLKRLSSSIDLGKPLVTLSDALRQNGNLGAHFDSEKEPDRETVAAMLDLLDYLLEYLYTLPAMINELDERAKS